MHNMVREKGGRPVKKLNRDNGGFSLAEVIVAVVILGIITVPLLHTLVTGANTARKSADMFDANNAAQSLVEQVKALGPDAVFQTPTKLSGAVLDEDESTDKIKIIDISTYHIAERDYSAQVTIDASDLENDTELSKSNPMDITIDMKYADNRAKNNYRNDCRVRVPVLDEEGNEVGFYYDYPNTDWLERSGIEISASRSELGEGKFSYIVKVSFNYHAAQNGKFRSYDTSVVSTSSVNVAALPEYGDAAFSVYLIYDAYFKSGDTIEITNPESDADYNVFLVNASKKEILGGNLTSVVYNNQRFTGGETCLRVYSNLDPDYVSYTANGFSGETDPSLRISGELVEKKAEQRRYMVTVKLFDGDKELVSIDAEMLK